MTLTKHAGPGAVATTPGAFIQAVVEYFAPFAKEIIQIKRQNAENEGQRIANERVRIECCHDIAQWVFKGITPGVLGAFAISGCDSYYSTSKECYAISIAGTIFLAVGTFNTITFFIRDGWALISNCMRR